MCGSLILLTALLLWFDPDSFVAALVGVAARGDEFIIRKGRGICNAFPLESTTMTNKNKHHIVSVDDLIRYIVLINFLK